MTMLIEDTFDLYNPKQMGPISPYGPKQFGRLTEQDILNQSQNFIREQQICDKTHPSFEDIKLVIAHINIFGHRHLLDHLRMFPDKQDKLRFLIQWKDLDLRNLDLIFQNLIRKKIMRVQEEQVFSKTQLHQKYSPNNRQELKSVFQRGEEILAAKKVAVIIFVGSSATICEENFDKQFYKEKETDQFLFSIIMKRLEQIGNKYGFPPTYIVYNAKNQEKVNNHLKSYKYNIEKKIKFCMQGNHPILNLNGNICLKAQDSGDVIEMPNGPAEFYRLKVGDKGILEKLKQDNVEYVSCCDCENILETVVDPYILGLLESQKNQYDLMYKCTFTENPKDRTFRRAITVNGVSRADSIQNFSSLINYNSPHKAANNEVMGQSPAWMNSLIFNYEKVAEILNSSQKMESLPKTITYKMKVFDYWSPIDFQKHFNETCYIFQKQLSDLFLSHLFKSKAVVVNRDEEYLPVITTKKEFNWKNAYNQYMRRLDLGSSVPFYDRLEQPEVPEVKPQVPLIIRKQQVQYQLLKKGKEDSK